MPDMVDFDFYGNTYLGALIPEAAFPAYASRAEEILDRLCRICRVEGGEAAKAMAVCAMAETLYREKGKGHGLVSAAVGEVSVRYSGEERPLLGRLYDQAGIYLDIYRGRGG